MKDQIRIILSVALLLVLPFTLTACGTLKPGMGATSLMETQIQPEIQFESSNQSRYEKHTNSNKILTVSRPGTFLVQGATVLVETTLIDPIIRPFSFTKAYYGLAIKSVGGFLHRSAINRVQFPTLELKPIPPVADVPAMDLESWERELDEITGSKSTFGKIKFLIDGEEYFSRLADAFDEAENTIDIRTYIYDNDDVGLEFANILKQKSQQVEIKILIDGLGDLVATHVDSESMPNDIKLPSSITKYLKHESKVRVRIQSNPWFTGDHVKTTIIDDKLAFLGGMNIGREYRYDWHDMMMEVSGPVVDKLQYEFDKTWAKSGVLGDFAMAARALRGYKRESDSPGYPVRVISTSIQNSEINRTQIAAIRRARNRIYIQNAYFSDDIILYELAKARRRGVDVRVIVSSGNDNATMKLSNESTINTMLKNGIRVYSYPGMTHLKAAVYDGWACLGSANFDKISLHINQEINLGTSHPETVQKLLDRVFVPDFAMSTELKNPIPLRWTHRIAEVIADEIL
ncbi:MAG: phosphatidylserine/phosphatidylglycerophosphate/cardiolipin synthase family protein [Gammaproteobacteria bacterium]